MTNIIDSCEFELLMADRSVLGREWKMNHRSEPYSRIYLIESGSGFVEHHEKRYTLIPGNLYLIPAHTDLSFGCGKIIVISWFHFNVLLEDGLDFIGRVNCPYELTPGRADQARYSFKRLIDLWKDDSVSVCNEFQQRSFLLQILSLFLKESQCSAETVSREGLIRFRPVLKHIEENIAGRIRVSALARQINMEPESFSRSFSKHFGASPMQFILRKKIGKAKEIMSESDRKLQDIAEELGFSDAFHLSKTFKKLTGKTPKEFKSSRMDVMP